MSLYGHKPKYKQALWKQLPSQQQDSVASPPNNTNPKRKSFTRSKSSRSTPQSAEKRKELDLYRKEAREFVANQIAAGVRCPVVRSIPELRDGIKYGWPTSSKLNEVHHTRGRLGPLLRDQRFWMAVSKAGHRWIHSHPKEARERGWLCDAGQWNKQPKE